MLIYDTFKISAISILVMFDFISIRIKKFITLKPKYMTKNLRYLYLSVF